MRLTAAGGADYCYAGRWCRGLGVEVDGGGGADYCYAGRWCRGWDGDRAAHIRRRLGNLNAGRWCRGLGWDGMGGLRFTAPGLSSRVAVNLNPPTRRNPEVGGGGGGAVDFFAAAPGVEVEVDGGGGADYCYAGRWCRG